MGTSMTDLTRISKYAGMREDLVQASGGNTSEKLDGQRMRIKSSGFQLADLTDETGFSVVDYRKINKFFAETPMYQIGKADEKRLVEEALINGKRPSIEVFLHSVTKRVTLHTHSVLAGALTCYEGGMEILGQLFPNTLLVPYATPGIELAKAYYSAWHDMGGKPVDIAFLQNHGVVVSGETAEEVIRLNETVQTRLAEYLHIDHSPWSNCTKLYEIYHAAGLDGDVVYLVQNRSVYEAFQKVKGVWNHAVCPDCVVYCGKKILTLSERFTQEDLWTHLKRYGKPQVICLQDQFYIIAPSVRKAKETESLMGCSAQVLLFSGTSQLRYLSEEEQNFLLNWDAEKYRKNMGEA